MKHSPKPFLPVPSNDYTDLENNEQIKGFSVIASKFINLWLSGEYNCKLDAIKAAGYKNKSDCFLERLAKTILFQFETQTDDKRSIMRQLGAGEIKIIQMKLHLAEHAKSEAVRNAAIDTLGKWIGLSREDSLGIQGDMVINIFQQEVTRRYEVLINPQTAPKSLPDHTDNTQKRYEPSKPLAITDPQKEKE